MPSDKECFLFDTLIFLLETNQKRWLTIFLNILVWQYNLKITIIDTNSPLEEDIVTIIEISHCMSFWQGIN